MKEVEGLSSAVSGALLSSRRGWTTGSLALSRDAVLRAIAPIVERELRKARGRTVGYCIRPRHSSVDSRLGRFSLMHVFEKNPPRGHDVYPSGLGCRVVILPKKGRPR